jgi:hypothetical protein
MHSFWVRTLNDLPNKSKHKQIHGTLMTVLSAATVDNLTWNLVLIAFPSYLS